MITKDEAINLGYGAELHYGNCSLIIGPRGGRTIKETRVRVSGRCQTWKTRPKEFRVPVKYGLYNSFAMTEYNAEDFHLLEQCPLINE